LAFGDHHVRQAECLGDGSPARLSVGQGFENPGMFLVELKERMVFVFVRITFPSTRRGKLTESISLHFEHEQSMQRVKDQKIALAADALVVRVIKAPANRPALAEATEFVRHLDLGFVAIL